MVEDGRKENELNGAKSKRRDIAINDTVAEIKRKIEKLN
jgi:hypothetical protein